MLEVSLELVQMISRQVKRRLKAIATTAIIMVALVLTAKWFKDSFHEETVEYFEPDNMMAAAIKLQKEALKSQAKNPPAQILEEKVPIDKDEFVEAEVSAEKASAILEAAEEAAAKRMQEKLEVQAEKERKAKLDPIDPFKEIVKAVHLNEDTCIQ